MLLAIEIGNTNLKFGLYEVEGPAAGTLLHTWRTATMHEQTADELAAITDGMLRLNAVARSSIERVAVASVVPALYRAVTGMAQNYFSCRAEFISAVRQAVLPVKIKRPEELGADLVAGAIGGVVKYGAPLIVIGFGTATTFAAVNAAGEYLGTAIAPGIEVSADALVARAAKLMSVPLVKPPAAIGTDTTESMQSGIIMGFVGQVEYLVDKIKIELGGRAAVVATGGLAELIAPHTRDIDFVDERLVLDGLYHWATNAAAALMPPRPAKSVQHAERHER